MIKKIFSIFILVIAVFTAYFLFKSTKLTPDIFEQQHQKAVDIYNHMSLDEKIGQLIQPSYQLLAETVSPNGAQCQQTLAMQPKASDDQITTACGLNQIQHYHLGAVLTGGGPYYDAPTLENWSQLNRLATSQHQLGAPQDPQFLIGNDTIHGNSHVQGAVIFPHNIGLGVTHNPELVRKIGFLVGQDSLMSGFNWVYVPTLAVVQDIRWGRSYESFSQSGDWVKRFGRAYVRGIQPIDGHKIIGPIATAKHFIGDGATQYGFDEGDDAYTGNLNDFWQTNGAGYEGALQAHVATLMISYNAINDAGTENNSRMHLGGLWNIVNQFKHQGIIGTDQKNYRFSGFTISDWNGTTRAAYFYGLHHPVLDLPAIFAKSLNAGVDMFMVASGDAVNPFDPHSPLSFHSVGDVFNALKTAYDNKLISPHRLQEAVVRILQVKLAMAPVVVMDYATLQAKERQLALEVAEQSLVLLKNDKNSLPLKTADIKNVIFVGDTNDVGIQNGGWTINWQGQKGDEYFNHDNQRSSGAITIEQAMQQQLPQDTHYYSVNDATKTILPEKLTAENTVVVTVVAEPPYAEFMGDIGNTHAADAWYDLNSGGGVNKYMPAKQKQTLSLQLSDVEAKAIAALRQKGISVITIVYSGRPVILSEGDAKAPWQNSDVVIAAFLPGTLGGQALYNAMFGDYHFGSKAHGLSNTLTFPWPENMAQVEEHFKHGAMFSVGYGLKT